MTVAIYVTVTIGLAGFTYVWGRKRQWSKVQWMMDEVHKQGLFIGGADAILSLAREMAHQEALEVDAALAQHRPHRAPQRRRKRRH